MTTVAAQQMDDSEITEALADDFCLGWWLVSPALNRIQSRQSSTNATSRHLEPRLTKLLCYLAANEGKVVSRDDLVKVLWPKVIVNENSLTRAVSELRKQLVAQEDSISTYIETIPKRGYRLLVEVEAASAAPARVNSTLSKPTLSIPASLLPSSRRQQIGFAALCFSVVSILGISQISLNPNTLNFDEPIQLADEIVGETSYFGGEVSLSNSDNSALESETIEAPIINDDKSHFAYIQYDRSGSTIFLGEVAEVMTEPVPIFNSTDKLFNLAWSPLGDSLLFAKQAPLTTAALFANTTAVADLYSINIETLESYQLVEQIPETDRNEATTGLNLT